MKKELKSALFRLQPNRKPAAYATASYPWC
jgi:hypothetical protein